MKKKLVSLVALASLFVIAGCGGDKKDSGKSETSDAPVSNSASGTTSSSTGKESDKGSSTITTDTGSSDTSSSDTGSSDSESESSLPEMVVKSVDELTTTAPTDNKTMYKVTGIWEHTGNDSDAYGNGKLVDSVSGNSLVVYGMAPTADAFTYTESDGYKFTNPKKFQDIISSFTSGDKITIGMVYSPNYKNYYTYFISKDADKSTFTYDVEIGTFENGTVTADKTSGIYGETVTLTVTPATDYAVDFVKHNDEAVSAVDGVYSFTIVAGKNVITAGFVSALAPVTSMTIDATNCGISTSYPKTEAETTIIDGRNTVTFKYYNYMLSTNNGIQSKMDAYLYNTTELVGSIDSITINANKNWSSTTSAISIAFADSALTSKPAEYAAVVTNKTTTTVTCTVENAKYLRIDHTVRGMVAIDSIVINYKTAA